MNVEVDAINRWISICVGRLNTIFKNKLVFKNVLVM